MIYLIRYGLIRRSSLLGRLILRLPLWLPIYVASARVGLDTEYYVTVHLKR